MNFKEIIAEANQNLERIRGCKLHRFPVKGPRYRPGEKLTCLACGGKMSLIDVGSYIRGYIAAGGNSDDIMPDWRSANGKAREGVDRGEAHGDQRREVESRPAGEGV